MEFEKFAESFQPERVVRRSASDIRAYSNSPQAKENAARAHSLGDEPTAEDLEQIPEVTDEQWATAVPMSQVLTVRVDSDVFRWFRQKRDYEMHINGILRKVMQRSQARSSSKE